MTEVAKIGAVERINKILNNPRYQGWIVAINQAETGREFCRHGLEHAFDVARIAYGLWVDNGGNPVARDIVYSAALLHDVGRWQEYEDSTVDHAEASAILAEPILLEAGFHPLVVAEIVKAIRSHRKKITEVVGENQHSHHTCDDPNCNHQPSAERKGLSLVLYEADKLSRPCYFCPAAAKCNWEKKNKEFIY